MITIVASLLLTLAATQLKERQDFNIEVDKKKNILKSIGLDVAAMQANTIIEEYKNKIQDVVLKQNGDRVNHISSEDLESVENKSTGQLSYFYENHEYLPAYLASEPQAFIFPVSGKGLWSTLYGYLALDMDLNTVKGITFYKHGETPGLGGEIEKKWFQDNFIGKKIFDNSGNLKSITVVKGKAVDDKHEVDGISGATITSRGVTDFLKRDLQRYFTFLTIHRSN
jgi:Na+-transporting NADH:ubiquinone oxidoreductase subunit C